MRIMIRSALLCSVCMLLALPVFAAQGASTLEAGGPVAAPMPLDLSQDELADRRGEVEVVPMATGNGSLTTLFAQNNGYRGNSFDIEASTCLEIVGWDFNFTNGAGVSGNVSVYWRTGTANNNENNSAGWNLLGTGLVTTAGNNQPTHLDVGGLVLQAGDLIGFYYWVPDYPNPRTGYTNRSAGTVYSNADMALTTYDGIGHSSPFSGSTFTGRAVNTTVHYNTLPASDPRCGGSGGGGDCDLTPIEAKLDILEPKVDLLAGDVAALSAQITALEATLAQLLDNQCMMTRLLHTPQGNREAVCNGVPIEWNDDNVKAYQNP